MQTIQCECGKFQADLPGFPKNSPGRISCYCDDCQTFLHTINRADLLDAAGGTEVIPVYPSEFKIRQGRELLTSTRLYPNGMFRWSTTCCNTPICNTRPGIPWAGLFHRVYTVKDKGFLERTLGPIKRGYLGTFARGPIGDHVDKTFSFSGMMVVIPFLLKGVVLAKGKKSPFFNEDGKTPIAPARVLTPEEREAIRNKIGPFDVNKGKKSAVFEFFKAKS